MIPKGISPTVLSLFFATSLPVLMTGCGKKAQIEYQTAQARQTMNELQVVARRADAEYAATGNLGAYQQTTPNMVVDLKRHIDGAKKTIEALKAEKEAAREKAEALQAETAAYRAKYRAL